MPSDEFYKEKIVYDALLRDIHTIDEITEVHARTIIITISGLLAFIVGFVRLPFLVFITSLVGLLISFLFLLKTIRHRQIFREQRDRLSKLEDSWNLDPHIRAVRPLKREKHPKIFRLMGSHFLGGLHFC